MGAESVRGGGLYPHLNTNPLGPRRFEPIPNLLTGASPEVRERNNGLREAQIDKCSSQSSNCKDIKQPTYSENVSLAEKINEIQALLGKKVEMQDYQQLEFNFSYTTSEEIFLKFAKSTSSLSEKLTTAQSETFLQIRQKIAMQFKIGGSITSEALIGFQQASENLPDLPETFDKLLRITNSLLSAGNSQDLNELLQQLRDIFSNFGDNERFEEFIDRFLNQWLEKLFPQLRNNDGNSNSTFLSSSQASSELSFSFQMEFRFEMSLEIQIAVQRLDQQQDPVVIDLDEDGIELTSIEDGVRFDISGTGKPVQTAWIKGGDAFLAWDRNGNSRIDNGLELFGDQWGAKNGFEELKKLDSNGDRFLGPEDAHYHQLVLWRDNGDGVSTQDELITLQQAGIERISLDYKDTNTKTDTNNVITQKSFYIRKNGSVGRIADVLLNYRV
ncbi:MAG: hypothetical protein N3G21_00230 [Candidatus Hydrogenedentes bacterium]|nr:hypothetical protein [Candidatus Hydrogenedentota bacterium]